MITVTNNKKKSLMRSKIILNVDFKTNEINKYNIPDDSIIVNFKGDVDINKKRFNGLNINDYEFLMRTLKNLIMIKVDYIFKKIYMKQEFIKGNHMNL